MCLVKKLHFICHACQKLEALGWCRFFHSDPSIQWQIYQQHISSVLNSLEACHCWWKLGIFHVRCGPWIKGNNSILNCQEFSIWGCFFYTANWANQICSNVYHIMPYHDSDSGGSCLCHHKFGFLNIELTVLYQWKASFQLSWGSVHAWQVHNLVNLTRELMDLFEHCCLFLCVFKKA